MAEIVIVNDIEDNILNNIQYMLEQNLLSSNCSKIGSGDHAYVYFYQNYAIKVFHSDKVDCRDYEILEQVQDSEQFPLLYAYIPKQLVIMEYISGKSLFDIAKAGSVFKDKWINQLSVACQLLFSLNIKIFDSHLNNMMIDEDDNLKIIDVGAFRTKYIMNTMDNTVDKIIQDYKNTQSYHQRKTNRRKK